MVNAGAVGRDAARLIALAEAVAEFAGDCDHPGLADRARDTACAARRFEAMMVPVDRCTVGGYRREFIEMLRQAHRGEKKGP